jgi:hypothetical protein
MSLPRPHCRISISTRTTTTTTTTTFPAAVRSTIRRLWSRQNYVIDHARILGYESSSALPHPSGCAIWTNQSAVHYDTLQLFVQELQSYSHWVKQFPPIQDDIRDLIFRRSSSSSSAVGDTQEQVCARLKPVVDPAQRQQPDRGGGGGVSGGGGGVEHFFTGSRQLSHTRSAGYVEPLLPPMRHPGLVSVPTVRGNAPEHGIHGP